MKILCWNVNSIKSCQEFLKTSYGSDYPTSPVSGIHSFFQAVGTPDLVCFQETKLSSVTATNESHLQVPGYDAFWSIASKGPSGSAKRGYSGTVTYARKGAVKFASSKFMKEPCYVNEGRITMTDHGGFVLLNVYFPNGGMNSAREKFKADFNNTFRTQVKSLFNQKRHVIVLGDFNVARLEIDVYNAEKYKSFSGHLPSEREWAEQLLADGFVDAYRHLHPDTTAKYTFWDQRRQLRPKNKGWRIDCFYVSKSLASKIKSCQLLSSIYGSDHCPITLDIDIPLTSTFQTLYSGSHDCDAGPRKTKQDIPIHAFFKPANSGTKRLAETHGNEERAKVLKA